jgi:hypothetical protein
MKCVRTTNEIHQTHVFHGGWYSRSSITVR